MILNRLDQFKAAIPTAVSLEEFTDVKTYVQSAELWLKNKVLGTQLYETVDADIDDNDLEQLCINIIANHAYWDAIPFLDLVHTDSGFGVIQSNNKVPASKERVERLRGQCLIRRDNEVENLIDYLEKHTSYHDAWKGSPTYSILTDCLIQTADEMKIYGQWEGTREEFLKLRPKLIQDTMVKLEPVFSKDYIQELIEKQRDNDLTGDDLRLSILLKQSLGSLVGGNMEAAEKIAADALRYIDGNLGSFGTYTESGEYAARIESGYENTADDPIFSSIIL